MAALSPQQSWRISFFTSGKQRLSLSDISIKSDTIRIVNAEGNTSTCVYVCVQVGDISGWRVDAHITLFKTYGRPPQQLLDEKLYRELVSLRDAFARTSIDGEFRNWQLLYTDGDLPRRALLEISGPLRDTLFNVRNALSQRFNVHLAERRRGFHLSLDWVHDALPGEPPLADRE